MRVALIDGEVRRLTKARTPFAILEERNMNDAVLTVLVPAGADALLMVVALALAGRLRRLQLNGCYQVIVLTVAMDAGVQTWQLWERAGQAAGVAWLVHAGVSYLAVYVLYRLSELLSRVGDPREMRVAERQTVAEGGG